MAKWMNEFVRMAVCSVDHPDFLVEARALWKRILGNWFDAKDTEKNQLWSDSKTFVSTSEVAVGSPHGLSVFAKPIQAV